MLEDLGNRLFAVRQRHYFGFGVGWALRSDRLAPFLFNVSHDTSTKPHGILRETTHHPSSIVNHSTASFRFDVFVDRL